MHYQMRKSFHLIKETRHIFCVNACVYVFMSVRVCACVKKRSSLAKILLLEICFACYVDAYSMLRMIRCLRNFNFMF